VREKGTNEEEIVRWWRGEAIDGRDAGKETTERKEWREGQGGREGARERRREGGKGGSEVGREGGREGGKDKEREGRKEGGKEGDKKRSGARRGAEGGGFTLERAPLPPAPGYCDPDPGCHTLCYREGSEFRI